MKKMLLLFFTISFCVLLIGCSNHQTEDMNGQSEHVETAQVPSNNGNEGSTFLKEAPSDKGLTEVNTSTEIAVQDWEEVEWLNVILQLPTATNKTYTQDTFQLAEQMVHNENMDEMAGMELIINTWDAEWSGGNYKIEYYEITTDPEVGTMISQHIAEQLREEYLSGQEPSALMPADGLAQKTIQLGEAPFRQIIQESESYQIENNKIQKQWEFVKDPYSCWRLSVTCEEEQENDIFTYISRSFDLKEPPEIIDKDEFVRWGDIELQIPFLLTKRTANERFRETGFDELNGDYLYTINTWEGETNGTCCVLTHYAVSSDSNETLFNSYYTGHLLSYSDSEFGVKLREKANELTWLEGERTVVREGRYPKEIDKSLGVVNADGKSVSRWFYQQNPCDMWELEISASKEEADDIIHQIDDSIRLIDGNRIYGEE